MDDQFLEQKMSRRFLSAVLFLLVVLLPLSRCGGRKPPTVVPVQGTVLLNGNPLPKASVTFVPQLEHFGAEFNSTAVTDENGSFTLTWAADGQTGAVVGEHVVLITEPSLPEEFRHTRDARRVQNYHAKQSNRPIPSKYNSVSQSPIRIQIEEGQAPVTIELRR